MEENAAPEYTAPEYTAPELRELGSLQELTEATSLSGPEDGGSKLLIHQEFPMS